MAISFKKETTSVGLGNNKGTFRIAVTWVSSNTYAAIAWLPGNGADVGTLGIYMYKHIVICLSWKLAPPPGIVVVSNTRY